MYKFAVFIKNQWFKDFMVWVRHLIFGQHVNPYKDIRHGWKGNQWK